MPLYFCLSLVIFFLLFSQILVITGELYLLLVVRHYCQHAIFMVFSKLLFPSFNPPYIQILTLTTLQFTNHTTQEQRDNSFHCKSKYKTGNCYVYKNPPPSYRSTKFPSTGEVSTTASQASRSSPTVRATLTLSSQ